MKQHVIAKVWYTEITYAFLGADGERECSTVIFGNIRSENRARSIIERQVGHSVLIIKLERHYDKVSMDAEEFVSRGEILSSE